MNCRTDKQTLGTRSLSSELRIAAFRSVMLTQILSIDKDSSGELHKVGAVTKRLKLLNFSKYLYSTDKGPLRRRAARWNWLNIDLAA